MAERIDRDVSSPLGDFADGRNDIDFGGIEDSFGAKVPSRFESALLHINYDDFCT